MKARFETGNRRPEYGNRTEAAGLILKPGNQEPIPGVPGFPAFESIPFCRAIRGRLGDRVYKTYGAKIVVTRVPCFDGYVPTVAQRQRREKMRAATAYAQAVQADPAARAVYVAAAKALGRQPFRLDVSDFLRGRSRVKLAPATSTRVAPDSSEPSKQRAIGPNAKTPRTEPRYAKGSGCAYACRRLAGAKSNPRDRLRSYSLPSKAYRRSPRSGLAFIPGAKPQARAARGGLLRLWLHSRNGGAARLRPIIQLQRSG
jgi:hypothetical protein